MPTGVLIPPDRGSANIVDDAVDKARAAADAGVRQLWLGQQLDYDAIGLAAVIGSVVPGVAVGTSVVPINPRHPLIAAAAAQTAQAATHGRFSLGLGLGVPFLEEAVFGISTSSTVERLREYLTALRAIRDDRTAFQLTGGCFRRTDDRKVDRRRHTSSAAPMTSTPVVTVCTAMSFVV